MKKGIGKKISGLVNNSIEINVWNNAYDKTVDHIKINSPLEINMMFVSDLRSHINKMIDDKPDDDNLGAWIKFFENENR